MLFGKLFLFVFEVFDVVDFTRLLLAQNLNHEKLRFQNLNFIGGKILKSIFQNFHLRLGCVLLLACSAADIAC
jgi:hypothetical protein